MRSKPSLARRDREFIQIVDAALADSAGRSGGWLACRVGCTQCCIGVFAINQLDALRLQQGMAELEQEDPERANGVRRRARAATRRLYVDFPGDASTGVLDASRPEYEDYANDEVCPVLDPNTGRCDLYEARPMTCRVFGPPMRSEDGVGVCELCFQGASDEQVAACELHLDADEVEGELVARAETVSGKRGDTIVAFALGS